MEHGLFRFLFLILANVFYYAPNTKASPIIHGMPADHHAWKFHVSIHKKREPQNVYRYACGGSIISEKHILTAGHCFVSIGRDMIIEEFFYPCGATKIIAGTNQRDGPGIERDIVKVFIPTGSNNAFLTVDLAVAKLSANLGVRQHSDVLAIMPYGVLDPNTHVGLNERAKFCGFGYDALVRKPNGKNVAESSGNTINRFMNVRIMSRHECQTAATMICGLNADTSAGFRTACLGDSGAGLIYDNKIVGVLSKGPHDCDSFDPIAFEKLYGNMRFISEALNPMGYHRDMHVLENSETRCSIH